MLRALLKTGTSHVLRWTGIDRLIAARGGFTKMPVVIGYHRVVKDFAAEAKRSIPAQLISVSMFQRHLDWLEQHYDLISLDELGATLRKGSDFGRPVAAITFDDGYRDNFTNAFPILLTRKIPAAMFVTTGVIGASAAMIHDELYDRIHLAFPRWQEAAGKLSAVLTRHANSENAAKRLPAAPDPFAALRLLLTTAPQAALLDIASVLDDFNGTRGRPGEPAAPLTWTMLLEMHRCGIVIGSHTRTHVLLTNEDRTRVQQELEISRREIEEKLGITVAHFSYPDGAFNADAIQAVSRAGYSFAYTTCGCRHPGFPMLTIPRRILWERSYVNAGNSFSGSIMACHLNGVFDVLTSCGHDHGSSIGNDSGWFTGRTRWAHS